MVPRMNINGQKVGSGPIPGKLHPFPKVKGASLVAQMVKESAHNTGDLGSIPGSGRSPGYPLKCSCLENCVDRGAWQTIVHGVAKSWARLSNWTELNWATNTTALSVTWFANISSRSIGCLFTLLMVSFVVKKCLMWSHWFIFALVTCVASEGDSKINS